MDIQRGIRASHSDVSAWSRAFATGTPLRPYQVEPARAILAAVEAGQGGQFALVFSRQAGKDETMAQIIGYLLARHQRTGGSVVMANPTLGQGDISRRRLADKLTGYRLAKAGSITNGVRLGRATATYLSAAPTANPRGATASLLLIANEAQDIDPSIWDARFDPMGASTNAVTVFSGTVWSDKTLLARQMRFLRSQELQNGTQRVFLIPWTIVERDVPAYGQRVRQRIAQLGPDHPFVQTEYNLRELDSAGGLFPPSRRALLSGTHPRRRAPEQGETIAMLVDVGGQEEDQSGSIGDGAELRAAGTRRDSTAITILAVTRPARGELPTYRVLDRILWTGLPHTVQHERLVALARHWGARKVIVDATGLGQGLAAFLTKTLGASVVVPFVFTAPSKSELGWGLVAAIDSGRLKDYADDGQEESRTFQAQLAAVEYEVRPGPGRLMAWGVPDPRLHDDLVLSLALVTVADGLDWRPRTAIGR